jgi:hypothetical protein
MIDWVCQTAMRRQPLFACLTDWLRLAGWLTDWLACWLTDWLACWLTDWLACWLTDWLACWLTDWLWLAGWLTGFGLPVG